MTYGAVLIPHVRLVMAARRIRCKCFHDTAVAFETKLPHRVPFQHFRIGRAVGRMTCRTAFKLQRAVLKDEWPLLVCVATDTGSIGAHGKPRLFRLETAVRVMAVAAGHCAFQNTVAERFAELRFHLGMTPDTQLGLIRAEHAFCRLARFLASDISD